VPLCPSRTFVDRGFSGCGKSKLFCHSERSEESLWVPKSTEGEIPRHAACLGMTKFEFFRSLFSRDTRLVTIGPLGPEAQLRHE
jgi:hypothetical protein